MKQIFNKTQLDSSIDMSSKKKKGSIQVRLVAVFLLTSLVLLAVNLILYQSMNRIVYRLDSIYATNVSLNELQEVLDYTQESLTQYLKKMMFLIQDI